MKKILILGVDGMLGHRVWREFRSKHDCEVFGTIKSNDVPAGTEAIFGSGIDKLKNLFCEIDAQQPSKIMHLIKACRPDVVINCIGIIKQRKDQADDHVQMIQINALLPHLIAQELKISGGRLITFSSDCVFLGNLAPYDEKCVPDAWSLYGRTKALGEVVADNALTLRTSFIGFEIKGFTSLLEWFMAASEEKRKLGCGVVYGFKNAIWSGLSTSYLAKWLYAQATEKVRVMNGLWHFGSKPVNKFYLLQGLSTHLRIPVTIEPSDKYEVDKICNRELNSRKFWDFTCGDQPDWEVGGVLLRSIGADFEFYKNLKLERKW